MALQITQVKSTNGAKRNQRATMESLGLRRIRHTVVRPDIPSVRGMIAVVNHLVAVTEVPDDTEVAADASRALSARDAGEPGGIGAAEEELGGVADAADVPPAQAPADALETPDVEDDTVEDETVEDETVEDETAEDEAAEAADDEE